MATLTKKQKAVYDFVKTYINKKGFSPTFEEIKKHFKLSALSGVHQHIETLEEKGFLTKSEYSARGLELSNQNEPMVQIPLLGVIAAGQPIEAIEESDAKTINLPKSQLLQSGKYYALKVQGNSMIGDGIFDGDTVVIRKQETADNGQTVVAIIDDNEATLKKIYKGKGRIKLQPANQMMLPIFRKEVEIRGVVVQIIRNLEEGRNKVDTEKNEFSDASIKYIDETDIKYRKSLGQYFTPKSIRETLLEKLPNKIIKPKILDPGCGTGEFLITAKKYFKNSELHGWDIDNKLTTITKRNLRGANIKNIDALLNNDYNKYDFVIGNPPYYEFSPPKEIKEKFKEIMGGRTNIFNLFIYQGIKWLKAGGYLAFVVPPSMNNGAYFARLRNFIIHNANIEHIEILKDSKIFKGALQSTMLLVLRKGENKGDYIFKKNGIVIFSENAKDLQKEFRNAVTLKDLGYAAKTGRVIWNQNKHLLTNNSKDGIPLIWAHNIDEKKLDLSLSISNPKKPQYIKRQDYNIGPAIVVNRITGSVSSTKLRAAIVPAGMKFFAENHVNVIFPPKYIDEGKGISLKSVAEQISSPKKSDVMKNVTGNTQISKTELENLFPLTA